MTFLFPAGLWALAALPLVLLPYLLRERPKPRVVPALFLYEGVERTTRLRLFGRPRLELLILLQILLLLAIVAAIARPALETSAVRAAIVVDNAATMQVTDASGASRLERALEVARARLDARGGALWDVFVLAPAPRALATGVDDDEAAEALRAVAAVDAPRPDEAGVVAFLGGLAASGYAEIAIVTDRVAGRRAAPFEVVSVGEPLDNVAIVSAAIVGDAERPRLAVSAKSFGAAPASRTVEVLEAESGRSLASAALELEPETPAHAELEVDPAPAYRVRLRPADRFAPDDEAFVVRPVARRTLLLVSRLGAASSGLAAVADALGLELEATLPGELRPERVRNADLVLFHRAAPAEPPPVPALYLLPPPAPFLPPPTGAWNDATAIAAADPTHPALRYLNPPTLRPRAGLAFRTAGAWRPLLVSAAGSLVLVHPGPPGAAASGIDLLPYLGDANRPASILLLDLLGWLSASRIALGGVAGEPIVVPPGALAVETSDGRRLAPPPARIETWRRGIYWIDFGDRREPRARTTAAGDSDLRARQPFPLPAVDAPEPRIVDRLRPLWPAAILLAALLLLVEATRHVRRRDGSGLAWALRAATLALLAAAFLDPERELPGEPAGETILLDASESVLPAAREEAARRARALAPGADVRRFAARLGDGGDGDLETGATDLESVLLRLAATTEGPRAAILASDGWETRGDARRAIPALRDRGIRLDVLPIAQAPPGNVAALRLALPARGEAGDAAEASLVVRNENRGEVAAEVVVRRGREIVGRRRTRLPPGESAIAFPVLLADEGLVEFSAEIRVADVGANRENADDLAKAWIAVAGRPSVLLVGRGERENRYVARALESRGFRVRASVAGRGVPSPEEFGAIVLNDLAVGDLPRGLPERLRETVARGGSLLMTGGTRSFGLGGWKGTPVEEALPVRMKEPERDEPRLAVALVIDKSGSMREERRMLYAREAARALAERLGDEDRLAVIGFDREAFVEIPLSPARTIRDDFERRIARLRPSGGTRLYPALVAAQRELLGEEAKRRHVIVLSDGLSEDAETSAGRRAYYDLALALSEQGVSVTTIALGSSADADFLERLAGFGRGAFHLTLDPSTLPELVLGEFRGPAPEKTLVEQRIRPLPDAGSPLVREIVRRSRDWPAILGLVETVPKPGARVDVATGLAGRPPLLASWSYGSGRAAAFTSDVYGRWSDPWVRWDEWSRLWAEIAGWLLPALPRAGAELSAGWDAGAIVVDAAFDEELEGEPPLARLTGPEGMKLEARFERVAPGFFRSRIAADSPGDYRIDVLRGATSLTRPPLGFTVPAARSFERPREAANAELLAELAAATGGRVDPDEGERPPLRGPPRREPLAPWLLGAAIVLFLLELLLRRAGASAAGGAAADREARAVA